LSSRFAWLSAKAIDDPTVKFTAPAPVDDNVRPVPETVKLRLVDSPAPAYSKVTGPLRRRFAAFERSEEPTEEPPAVPRVVTLSVPSLTVVDPE